MVVATIKTARIGVGGSGQGAGSRNPEENAHSNQSCSNSPWSEVGRKERLGHQKDWVAFSDYTVY